MELGSRQFAWKSLGTSMAIHSCVSKKHHRANPKLLVQTWHMWQG